MKISKNSSARIKTGDKARSKARAAGENIEIKILYFIGIKFIPKILNFDKRANVVTAVKMYA